MFAHCLRKPGLFRVRTPLLGCGVLVVGFSLIVSPASRAQESGGPVVTVTGGQVQGRLLPTPEGAVFKGIPYAAPPIGDLRWRETQPVKPWKGVLQAGEYGAICTPNLDGNAQHRVEAASSKEDCLTLNVWTPEWNPNAKRPVMMWIHGGGTSGGSARGGDGIEPPFDGTRLARHGVVVVTVEYRPGLFGMVGHPELTAESPHQASGNYAVFDQVAALKWIRDNITRFGGDPGNVTIFGQSAGGRYASFLPASPLAKGLFHRAILESGSATANFRPIMTQAQLEQLGVALAVALNAPSTGAIKYLRSLPASQIAAAMPEVRKRLNEMNLGFDTGIDGYAIPQSPTEVYKSHKEPPVPMIVGSVSLDSGRDTSGVSPKSSAEEVSAWVKHRIETVYGPYPDLLDRALQIYGFRGSPNEVSTNPAYSRADNQLAIDLGHRCGAVATAVWHSTIAPTYHFEFTHTSPGHPPLHASELRFIFGYLKDEESNESARKYSDIMQEYWTNFAKTGDPNGPGLPVWPKYNATTKQSVEFTNDGVIQKTIRAGACGLYVEKLTRDPKPLYGSNCVANGVFPC
jgi:para-nitrobenzyl esterase